MRKVVSAFTSLALLAGLPAVASAETRTDLVLTAGQTLSATFDQPAGVVTCPVVPFVVTAGPVSLGGATLALSTTVPPGAGYGCLLIDNRGPGAVSGTFAGLPQGTVFGPPDARFRISYTAGDGNDVQLQRVEVASTITSVNVGFWDRDRHWSGNPVDFSVWVGGGTPTALAASGTVSLTLDGTPVGTQSLRFAGATFSLGVLADGPHEARVSYSGDGFYLPSTLTSTIMVEVPMAPQLPGAPVTAPAAPASPPAPTPTAPAPATPDPAPAVPVSEPSTSAIRAGLRTIADTRIGARDVRFTQEVASAGSVRWRLLARGKVLATRIRAVEAGLVHARVPLRAAARRSLARNPRQPLRLQTTLTTATGRTITFSASLR